MNLCELLELEEELEDYIDHLKSVDPHDEDADQEFYENLQKLKRVQKKIVKKLKKELLRRT